MSGSQRSTIESPDESDGESDEEQRAGGRNEIERLRALLAEERAGKQENERLVSEKEGEKERLLALGLARLACCVRLS